MLMGVLGGNATEGVNTTVLVVGMVSVPAICPLPLLFSNNWIDVELMEFGLYGWLKVRVTVELMATPNVPGAGVVSAIVPVPEVSVDVPVVKLLLNAETGFPFRSVNAPPATLTVYGCVACRMPPSERVTTMPLAETLTVSVPDAGAGERMTLEFVIEPGAAGFERSNVIAGFSGTPVAPFGTLTEVT